MRHLGLKVPLAAAALAALAGCGGCYHPPPGATLIATFTQPTDGQNLTSNQLPIDVIVQASDSSGGSVTIKSATLNIGAQPGVWTVTNTNGTINGSKVTFPKVALALPTNFLSVSVTDTNSRVAVTPTIKVTVGVPSETVTITQPASGAVLNASTNAADGGSSYQIAFSVTSTGLNGDHGVLSCQNACGIPPTAFAIDANGKSSFNITLTEPACLETAVTCMATVTDGAGQAVNSANVNFTLDSVPPEIAIAAPVAPVSSQSFTVTAVVTCAEDGSTATLTPPTGSTLSTTVTGGVVNFPNVTVTADGSFVYTLTVTDKGGNRTSIPVPVVVQSVAPVISIAVPAASAQGVISTDADGNPANGVQADVVVTVDSEPVGTEVDLFTTVSGTTAQPRRSVTATVGSHKQATVRVDLAEGANTLQACVSNAAGRPCPNLPVTVSTGRANCRILTPADNEYRGAPGNPLLVSLEAAAGAVTLNAVDSTGTVKASASGTSTGSALQLSVTLPADGDYHLVATCAGNGVSQNLPIRLDTSTPTVAAVVRGDTGGTGNLGPNIIDTSPQSGLQVILDVTVGPVPLKAYSNVVVTGCGMASGATGTTDASGKVAIRNVTVPQSGPTCQLNVVATDIEGNAKTYSAPITPAFSNGSLYLVDPAPGSTLTGGADGGSGTGLTVPVTLSFTTQNGGGTLTLYLNGVSVKTQAVAASDTSATLTNIQLAEGPNAIRATINDQFGNTACTVATVYVNTKGSGNIVLTQPGSRSLLIGDDVDPNTPGIQYLLQYSAAPKSTNFSVDVCSSVPVGGSAPPCRDGSGGFTLASNVPAFVPSFTYPDGNPNPYTIWAVLDDNGAISSSPKDSLVVDSVRPKVMTVAIPADKNGDGILDQQELQALAGSPVVLKVTTQNLDNGGNAKVTDATTGTTYGQATSNGSGTVSISLTSLPPTQETTFNFVVNLTRSSGNTNKVANPTPLDPLNTAAFVALNVDSNVPAVTITSPSKTVLGLADLLPGNKIRVTALIPDSDIPNNGVTITPPATVTPGTPVQLTPVSGQVSQDFAINTVNGVQQFTFAIAATDIATNVGNASITLTASLSDPVVTITAPTANSTVNSHTVTVTATVTGYNLPATVQVFDSYNGGAFVLVGTLPLSGGVATGTLSGEANGLHAFKVVVADGAGNPGSATVSPVTVAAPGCTIQFTKPSTTPIYFGKADDLDLNTAGLQYQVQGTTPDCHALTATLCSGSSCTGSNTLATQTADPVTGNFTFAQITLADSSSGQLTIGMNNGVATSSTITYTVKLTPPVLSGITPSQSTLYYVAASNINLLVLPATPGYIADLAPAGPPFNAFATANFSFQVANAIGGTATLTYAGTPLGSVPITTDPQTVSFTGMHLGQKTSGNLVFAATDPANNVASSTANVAAVDVIPPEPFSVDAGVASTRAANVTLSWAPSFDDWNAGGPPAGYDIRWSTGVVLPAGIPDDTTYFDLTTPKVQQAGGAVQPPSSTTYTLSGVPPLNTYWIATRAVDGVGNYSPFEPTTQSVYPQTVNSLDNFWTKATFNSPDTTPFYSFVMGANGDFDGDGFDDLVVTSSQAGGAPGPGYVYVYYGATNFSSATPVRLQETNLPTNGDGFGVDMGIGDVGYFSTVNEHRPDLLVGAKHFSSNRGRAFLFFGQQGSRFSGSTPSVEFRGTTATAGQLGFQVAIINDINGDGLDEVLVAAPLEATYGKVYLFYGRQVSAWTALATATDPGDTACGGSPCPYIPTSAADRVFPGNAAATQFGRYRGYASLGDIEGTGKNDLMIPEVVAGDTFLFSGQTVDAAAAGSAIPTSSALQTLTGGAGFGYAALGGLTTLVGNNTGFDLAVTNQAASAIYLYADGTATGFASNPPYPLILTRAGNSGFGFTLAAADLNGDGRPDLAIGENPGTGLASAWVFYHHTSGTEFDLAATTGFAQSRLQNLSIPNSSLGLGIAVGDFNGDGKPDLAAGDPIGSSVSAWY